jgi:hypothetical protein
MLSMLSRVKQAWLTLSPQFGQIAAGGQRIIASPLREGTWQHGVIVLLLISLFGNQPCLHATTVNVHVYEAKQNKIKEPESYVVGLQYK